MYQRTWAQFVQFASAFNLSHTLPISVPTLSLFLAHLVSKGLAASTISTYISAIGYVHKLNGLSDPTASFIVRKLLSACHKSAPRIDHRLPITKRLLGRLIKALKHTTCSYFDRLLYSAMFTLAFHAFLRIGEMTLNGSTQNHNLQLHQLSLASDNLQVCFLHYKHSSGSPFQLIIKAQQNKEICAVFHLRNYLAARGHDPGPIFMYPPGSAVSRAIFCKQLQQAINFCGLDPARFKSHSFRIGIPPTTKVVKAGYRYCFSSDGGVNIKLCV